MNRRIVFDCDQWLERLVLLGFDERMQETAETGICLSLQIAHTHTHVHTKRDVGMAQKYNV